MTSHITGLHPQLDVDIHSKTVGLTNEKLKDFCDKVTVLPITILDLLGYIREH